MNGKIRVAIYEFESHFLIFFSGGYHGQLSTCSVDIPKDIMLYNNLKNKIIKKCNGEFCEQTTCDCIYIDYFMKDKLMEILEPYIVMNELVR